MNKMVSINDLVQLYYRSNDFDMLRDTTKNDYKYFLGVVSATVGNEKFTGFTSRKAKWAYEEWVRRGVSFANHVATCASRVFNYAVEMEYAMQNPFTSIKRKTEIKRKVVWKHEDVLKFLDVAYSDFTTRNIGLIIQMTYEWCQRIGDMRTLEWEDIDFDD